MEKDIDHDYSPWMPNILTCVRDIVTNGFHETSERLSCSGLEACLFETVKSVPLCKHEMLPTVFPVVFAMIITATFAIYSIGMIKLVRVIFELDLQVAAELSKTLWSGFYSAVTIICAKHLIQYEHNYFFFHPSSSLDEWNPCDVLSPKSHIFFLIQMAYHLHSTFYSFIDDSEKGRDFYVTLARHISTTLLLALVFFLSICEPLVIFLLLFGVRNLLWISFKLTTSMGKSGGGTVCNILANILLVTCYIVQFWQMYWYLTKLIYFFAVIYPTYIKQSPSYHLLQFLLWIIYAIEVLRFAEMGRFCWMKSSSVCLMTPGKPTKQD